MAEQFTLFGWICVVVFGLTIAVPYLTRRSDLFTVWNLFLLGSMNFIGYAAIQTADGVYAYGLFEDADYGRYLVGAVVLYVTLYVTYYRFRLPGKLAGRTLRSWPGGQGTSLVVIQCICFAMLFFSVFFPNIQFVGQILIIVGPAAGVIAVALGFARWWQNKASIWMLVLIAFLLVVAMFAAIHGQAGRRSLLSVLIVVPLVLYWIHLRYKPLVYTIVPLAIGVLVAMSVIAAYSSIRSRYHSQVVNTEGRTSTSMAIESLKMLPRAIMQLQGITDFLGGDSVDASLVAIDRYTKVAEPEPFFTFMYVLEHPIPRAIYPDKREALGLTLPRDTGVWERTGYVNWGPGIVGHGFHEGGRLFGGMGPMLFLVLYGVVFGSAMRYFDELLIRQPDNPYILGIFAAASGQIIAFSRGDIALFSVLILGAVLAGLMIKFIGRVLVGNTLIYPSDAERAETIKPAPESLNEWGYPQGSLPATFAQN